MSLDLLPGIKLPPGIFQTQIQYITDVGGMITMHHMSENMLSSTKNKYIIGNDVREISFQIYYHNSFPTNPLINHAYTLRIDRLIMLNLACKLIKKPLVGP
jgi:hypothetical protein